ncbi:hypothetical protein DRP04_15145 [Archaeoglobales archaeon]|nr:MAG: hypothetical protein DRP04_15145 [Archaeoglobales archaeon]
MTGKNPGKHGIYHYIEYVHETYDYRVVTSSDIKSRRLWSILSDFGKKVGVVQVPMVYPPDKVNGFFISGGLTTPSDENINFTYPPNLRDLLIKKFKFKIGITERCYEGNEDNFLADVNYTDERKAKVTLYLMKNYDWDFFMVVFVNLDAVQHFFWRYMDTTHPGYDPEKAKKYGDAILNCYKKYDGFIGKMLDVIDDETTVIVMSDHGFGPLYKELHLNKWLMDKNLLKVKEKKDIPFHRYLLSRTGLTREMVATLVNKLHLEKIAKSMPKRLKRALPSHYVPFEIDWSRTKAYSVATHGLLYINLKGRNPSGIVEPGEEYEELRNYIIRELYKLKDPENGKKIVVRVYKREELYRGKYVNKAPDLLVMTDMTYQNIGTLDNTLLRPSWKPEEGKLSLLTKQRPLASGSHRMEGIFIMKGENVKRNEKIKNAEIIDIAPTILHMMGVPVPLDMDGKVLKDAFK